MDYWIGLVDIGPGVTIGQRGSGPEPMSRVFKFLVWTLLRSDQWHKMIPEILSKITEDRHQMTKRDAKNPRTCTKRKKDQKKCGSDRKKNSLSLEVLYRGGGAICLSVPMFGVATLIECCNQLLMGVLRNLYKQPLVSKDVMQNTNDHVISRHFQTSEFYQGRSRLRAVVFPELVQEPVLFHRFSHVPGPALYLPHPLLEEFRQLADTVQYCGPLF